MNELSPRRTPRSPMAPPKTPPQWKRPEEVMKRHRLKASQQSLVTKMNRTELLPKMCSNLSPTTSSTNKRKNPFRMRGASPDMKRVKEDDNDDNDNNSLLRLLGLTDPQLNNSDSFNINEIIMKIKMQTNTKNIESTSTGSSTLPVDWALRTKIRFMSPKPFPWTQTLKTCEEASGITGFVRCVDNLNGIESLDTSPNAVFHQHCCYWQHPSLPWLRIFPRSRQADDKTQPVTNQPRIKESLHREWTDSFRSLYQLVRTRQCPYFYMVGNLFSCVFRAAGVHGQNQINALLTPTSIGFRQLMKDEGIQFKMPLKRKSSVEIEETDDLDGGEDDDGQGKTREWLASVGFGQEEINRISSSQEMMVINSKKKSDGDHDSLIYIEGCEAQAFYNFLINCKSLTPTTGPLSGVPPTLVAPVAFLGASLSTLKVRESIVREGLESYYSMEVQGPILPHTVLNLCNILKDYVDKYSVTFATLESTKAFSKASKSNVNEKSRLSGEGTEPEIPKPEPAFNQESLSDCGLQLPVLSQFCSYNIELYDSIKYSDELYSWV